MAVYVDNARHAYGRMIMCHLLADTLPELFDMVDKIGVARRHFQATSTPHFDICRSKRNLAVKLGAQELDRRGLREVIQRWRRELENSPATLAEVRNAACACSASVHTYALGTQDRACRTGLAGQRA